MLNFAGSLHNLMHIAGSLLAGYLQERCGRKGCMLFGVIPQVIGCALLLYSTQPKHLYLSSVSIGIGAALGEVPIATYISETASSRLRGRLFFFTKFGYGLGALFMFFLSNYVKWRNLALISAACPLITACYLLTVRILSQIREKMGICNESLCVASRNAIMVVIQR